MSVIKIIDKGQWYLIDYPMAVIILKLTGLIEDYLELREPIKDNLESLPLEKIVSLCSCLAMLKANNMINMPSVFTIVKNTLKHKYNISTLEQFDEIREITQSDIDDIKICLEKYYTNEGKQNEN